MVISAWSPATSAPLVLQLVLCTHGAAALVPQ